MQNGLLCHFATFLYDSLADEFRKKIFLFLNNIALAGTRSWTAQTLDQIGSFFMINLCLVVIATQFSETKRRETAKMKAERAKFASSSTLSSYTNRFHIAILE